MTQDTYASSLFWLAELTHRDKREIVQRQAQRLIEWLYDPTAGYTDCEEAESGTPLPRKSRSTSDAS